jgi:hypothetical protein
VSKIVAQREVAKLVHSAVRANHEAGSDSVLHQISLEDVQEVLEVASRVAFEPPPRQEVGEIFRFWLPSWSPEEIEEFLDDVRSEDVDQLSEALGVHPGMHSWAELISWVKSAADVLFDELSRVHKLLDRCDSIERNNPGYAHVVSLAEIRRTLEGSPRPERQP